MLPVLRRNGGPAASVRPANRIDHWFDQVFHDMDRIFGESGIAPVFARMTDSVPISVWEDDDRVYVEAELPGVSREDVELTVHNGTLQIKGERKPAEDRKYLYNSRSFGRFELFVNLPESAGADDVQAAFADGLLRLTLTKKAEAKPRRIEIQPSNG
jgi:HSP20 family protein